MGFPSGTEDSLFLKLYKVVNIVEIESGFPFILDSKREREDDYSMGGGASVLLFDTLALLAKVSPKINQFEKKLRKAKLSKKGVDRGELRQK